MALLDRFSDVLTLKQCIFLHKSFPIAYFRKHYKVSLWKIQQTVDEILEEFGGW